MTTRIGACTVPDDQRVPQLAMKGERTFTAVPAPTLMGLPVIVTEEPSCPLACLAACAPGLLEATTRQTLGGVDQPGDGYRRELLATLAAWFDGHESTITGRLRCDRNTARHRLNRRRQLTRRPATNPQDEVELCLTAEALRLRDAVGAAGDRS